MVSQSQLHRLVACQDVEVDTVVCCRVCGKGGAPVQLFLVRGTLDCDDPTRK